MLRCTRCLLEAGGWRRKSRHTLDFCYCQPERLSMLVYRRDSLVFPLVQLLSCSDRRGRTASDHGRGLFPSDCEFLCRQRRVRAFSACTQARALDNGRMHLVVPRLSRRHAAGHIVALGDRSRADVTDSAGSQLRRRRAGRGLSHRFVLARLGSAAPRPAIGSDGSTNGPRWRVSAWRGRRITSSSSPSGF